MEATQPWSVTVAPADQAAAQVLAAWTPGSDNGFDGTRLDLSHADLRGAPFAAAQLGETNLSGTGLVGADLYAASLVRTNLSRATLVRASLAKAELEDVDLTRANLELASLRRAELYRVVGREARLVGADLTFARLSGTDLRGADLSGATLKETRFDVWLDDTTVLTGLRGSFRGPAFVTDASGSRELGGAELVSWLNGRGAEVDILENHIEVHSAFAPTENANR